MRVSERRGNSLTIPNRVSSERHDACIDGRVAFEVDEINESRLDRRSNLEPGTNRVADVRERIE